MTGRLRTLHNFFSGNNPVAFTNNFLLFQQAQPQQPKSKPRGRSAKLQNSTNTNEDNDEVDTDEEDECSAGADCCHPTGMLKFFAFLLRSFTIVDPNFRAYKSDYLFIKLNVFSGMRLSWTLILVGALV